jgi:hypothetical protein
MKCNCGYDDTDSVVTIGIEPFIRTELKVTYESEGDYYKNLNSRTVYICPKCGTLKINLSEW